MEKLNNASIPAFLLQKLNKQYGKEITNQILKGYSSNRKVTIRINTIKTTTKDICTKLENENIEFEKVKWYKDCLIIKNATESDLRSLDMYNNGEIYLQNLSSMIPPIILNPSENTDILDMAAAPGRKNNRTCSFNGK